MLLDRSVYLTADRQRVVEEGDLDAAFLLAAAGHEIPDEEAARLGLTASPAPTPAPAPAPAEPDAPVEEPVKAKKAPANKARKNAPNKSK